MAKDKQKFQKDCLLYRQFLKKNSKNENRKTFNIGIIFKTKGNVHLMKSQASDLNYLGVRRLFPQYRLGINFSPPFHLTGTLNVASSCNFHQIIQRQSVPYLIKT